jgi:hypothetical protein
MAFILVVGDASCMMRRYPTLSYTASVGVAPASRAKKHNNSSHVCYPRTPRLHPVYALPVLPPSKHSTHLISSPPTYVSPVPWEMPCMSSSQCRISRSFCILIRPSHLLLNLDALYVSIGQLSSLFRGCISRGMQSTRLRGITEASKHPARTSSVRSPCCWRL